EPRILDALEQLFVQQGRWDDCIELVEKRVVLADSDRQRIAMLLNLAALAHDKLGDDARAIAAYEKILELDPAHEIAARQLEQLYTDGAHWAQLTQLLLERADRTNEIAPLMTVAHVYEDKIADAHAAYLVWLTVFRRDPERPHLIERLDRLAAQTDQWDELLAETR